MWNVTLKGLLAKKFRLVLTSIAVVLGVAFMSGTFVLTDTSAACSTTCSRTPPRGSTRSCARSARSTSTEQGGGAQSRSPSRVGRGQREDAEGSWPRAPPGVRAISARTVRRSAATRPDLRPPWFRRSSRRLVEITKGRRPRPDEIVVDQQDAEERTGSATRCRSRSSRPRRAVRGRGHLPVRRQRQLGGRDPRRFEPTTAQGVVGDEGVMGPDRRGRRAGVSETELRRPSGGCAQPIDEHTFEVDHRGAAADEQPDDCKDLSFFNTFLLVFARSPCSWARSSSSTRSRSSSPSGPGARAPRGRWVRAGAGHPLGRPRGVRRGPVLVGRRDHPGRPHRDGLQGPAPAFGIDLPRARSRSSPARSSCRSSSAPASPSWRRWPPRDGRRASHRSPRGETGPSTAGPYARRYLSGGPCSSFLGIVCVAPRSLRQPVSAGARAPRLVGISALTVFIGVAMLSPLLAPPAARLLTWPPGDPVPAHHRHPGPRELAAEPCAGHRVGGRGAG